MTDDGLRAPDELHADHFAIVPEYLLDEKADVVKLYGILDRLANRDRCLWPGQAKLAERMECSDRHIRRLLNRLEEIGALLEVKRRYNGSTLYRLLRTPPDPTWNLGPGSPERPDPGVRSDRTDRTEQSALAGPGSPPNESHLSRATKTPKGAKLPFSESFVVTDGMRKWAAENVPSVDIDAETEAWRDHHLAAGSVFASWEAAWRKWMRNSARFQAERARPHGPRPAPNRPDPNRNLSQNTTYGRVTL